MPSDFMSRRLVAASPQMTSALGLSFSASSFAVTMPVESRTHLISMSGWSSLKRAAYFFRSSASTAVYTVRVAADAPADTASRPTAAAAATPLRMSVASFIWSPSLCVCASIVRGFGPVPVSPCDSIRRECSRDGFQQ